MSDRKHATSRRFVFGVVILLAAIGTVVIARGKRNMPRLVAAPSPRMVTCDYDISKLPLARLPSFYPPDSLPYSLPANGVTQLITDRIAPGTWRPGFGTITLSGLTITVTHTIDVQVEVARLLDALKRSPRDGQVSLVAHFLKWNGRIPDDADPAIRTTLHEVVKPRDGGRQSHLLTDAQASELLLLVQKSSTGSIITAPQIKLFNGQRAYVMVATSRAYISGYVLRRKIDGAVENNPQLDSVQSGVILDAQPLIAADGKSVSVSLHPNLTNLLAMKSAVYPNPFNSQFLCVQTPVTSKFAIDETIDIPLDRTLLIGGLTQIDPPSAMRDYPAEPVITLIKANVVRP